jgi:glycosyltransferase involved in cell wall biosynthesis
MDNLEKKMKVLYVAYHDPTVMDLASGVDYFHYQAISEHGFDVKIINSLVTPPVPFEHLLERIYKRTGNRYMKFNMTTVWRASQATNQAVREWKPDLVFTIAHFPLVFYTEDAPCVYSADSTSYGVEKIWPVYGQPAQWVNMWQEKRAYKRCSRILTNSDWSKKILIDAYGVSEQKIRVFILASALPSHVIPKTVDVKAWKSPINPLRLLLVGRDYRRKGIDIGIDIANKLNAAGVHTELTICGAQGKSAGYVKFVGPYKKSDPNQLTEYVSLYRQAHLLIHPALFEAAGIVPSEAAAFGTPTITNDTGGLSTSVKDGESGFVLPKGSPAEAYVQKILELINNPDVYYELCHKTRDRYERELNWGITGKWLADTLREVIFEHRAVEGIT